MKRLDRAAVPWLVATLPVAALAGVAYTFFEWLFFITKPSPLAALPWPRQLIVLVRSPAPVLLPLLLGQMIASGISVVGYPRLRAVALAPAAIVGGTMLFVMLDNFTYTVFGFGVLTVGLPLRAVYAALLLMLMVLAGWKLQNWLREGVSRTALTLASAVLAVILMVGAPTARGTSPQPDVSAPPAPSASHAATRLPNILFLGIDGVDAQTMSLYGSTRPTTPFLEHLRDESLVFDNAFSNVGRTHGSLVALLTGRLPFTTHVTFPPTILQNEDAHRHLPAILKGLGYTTLQLGMRHYADAEDANLLGFDAANYRWQRLEDVSVRSDLDEAAVFRADMAERLDERLGQLFGFHTAAGGYQHVEGITPSPYWSDARRVETLARYFPVAAEPWFVHVHLLDSHCCAYHPRERHFSGGNAIDDVRDSQLRETDDSVRQIVEALVSTGVLDRTIVVVYSDHTNGWTTTGRVPLMMRFPGGQPREHVSANVQLVDVAPTMVKFLGEPIPDWMDGLPLLDPGAIPEDRPIFGVSAITDRQGVAPFLTALNDAGPPNYGAGSVTMIAGNQWFELALQRGSLQSGLVAGHSHPGPWPGLSDALARRQIEALLEREGFQLPPLTVSSDH